MFREFYLREIDFRDSEPAKWDFLKIKLTSFAKINLCQSTSNSLLASSALNFNQTYFSFV